MTDGKLDIKARIRQVEEEMGNGIRKAEELLGRLKYLKELSEKGNLTEEEVRRAMDFTCFGSLAFCCGTEKQCFHRDSTLEALGLTHEDFNRVKKDLTNRIIGEVLARRKGGKE